MKHTKKLLSLLLVLVMVLGMLPGPVLAVGEDDPAGMAGYATVEDLNAAFETVGETDDVDAALAALDEYLAVYDRLSDEDKAANAEAAAAAQAYRDSLVAAREAGDGDEDDQDLDSGMNVEPGIQTLADWWTGGGTTLPATATRNVQIWVRNPNWTSGSGKWLSQSSTTITINLNDNASYTMPPVSTFYSVPKGYTFSGYLVSCGGTGGAGPAGAQTALQPGQKWYYISGTAHIEIRLTHTHQWSGWKYNSTQHWKECTICGEKTSQANHSHSSSVHPADCYNGGYTSYSNCVCGYSKANDNYTSRLAPDYTGQIWYTWNGQQRMDCKRCGGGADGHYKTQTAQPINVTYTVNHHYRLNGTQEASNQTTGSATAGTVIYGANVAQTSYGGKTYNYNSSISTTSITLNATGSNVLDLYYDRTEQNDKKTVNLTIVKQFNGISSEQFCELYPSFALVYNIYQGSLTGNPFTTSALMPEFNAKSIDEDAKTITWEFSYETPTNTVTYVRLAEIGYEVTGYTCATTVSPTGERFAKISGTYQADIEIPAGLTGRTYTITNTYTPTTPVITEADYTVNWYDTDGNVLKAPETRKGTVGTTVSATSDDKSVGGYIYLEGQSTSSATLAASGTELKLYFAKKITVTWYNEAGTVVLDGPTEFTKGDTEPSYSGQTPTKAEDENYTYAFAGWVKMADSTEDAIKYKATFTATPKPPVGTPNLTITKTVDATTANVGDTLTYTITVTNSGKAAATNVTVTDILPAGLKLDADSMGSGTYWPSTRKIEWKLGTLAANGGTATVQFEAEVTATGTIRNTATVDSDETTPKDSAPADVTATNTPKLTITKKADKATVNVGDIITYTITVKNTGKVTATNVTITDKLDSKLEWQSAGHRWTAPGEPLPGYDGTSNKSGTGTYGTQPAGGVYDLPDMEPGMELKLTITAKAIKAGKVENTATVKGDDIPDQPSNKVDVTVEAKPEQNGTWQLDISKYVSNADNKGTKITAENMPEDYAIDVKVSYLDPETMQRKEETKTLTLQSGTRIATVNEDDWTATWTNVFTLPDWKFDVAGNNKTWADVAGYNTVVTITEKNYKIAGYGCTASSLATLSGNEEPVEGKEPVTYKFDQATATMTATVWVENSKLNRHHFGLGNDYRMYTNWVQMKKVAKKTTVKAGETVEYTVTFYNYTGQPQTVNFADVLPQGMTLTGDVKVSGATTAATHNSLNFDFVINAAPKKAAGATGDPRATVTVSYTATAASNLPAGTKLENKVTAKVGTASYTDTATVTVTDNGNGIKVEKTLKAINGDATKTQARTGDVITWNVKVTNLSNVKKTVALNEMLRDARLDKYTVTLEAGASETVTATYTVKETDDAGTLKNVVVGVIKKADGTLDGDEEKGEDNSVRIVKDGTYTLKYNANGGTGAPADQTQVNNNTFAISEGRPTRNNYTFQGWALTAGGAVAYQPGGSITISGTEQTLYAIWRRNTPVIPDEPDEPDEPITYTLTINYVDAEGNVVASQHRESLESGTSYSVPSPDVEGMTPDQAVVSGRLTGNTTVTVRYTADEEIEDPDTPTTETPEPTESPEPSEEPGDEEDLGDEDTPLAELPDTEPDESEDLADEDTPLANVPQTGDKLWLWIFLTLCSAAGLFCFFPRKKGKREV